MKLYTLIEINGLTYLREKNPLEGTRCISETAYREHERLYIESAFLFPDAPIGRTTYNEAEFIIQWQFRDKPNLTWHNVSEPAFVGTQPNQYRQIVVLLNPERFQDRVKTWIIDCFGPEYAVNTEERCMRLVEEVIELVQALGLSKDRVLRQLVWTYGREPGEVKQEFGGVMVTLAALAAACNIDLKESGDVQICQNIANSPAIKAKHQLKIEKGLAL